MPREIMYIIQGTEDSTTNFGSGALDLLAAGKRHKKLVKERLSGLDVFQKHLNNKL